MLKHVEAFFPEEHTCHLPRPGIPIFPIGCPVSSLDEEVIAELDTHKKRASKPTHLQVREFVGS